MITHSSKKSSFYFFSFILTLLIFLAMPILAIAQSPQDDANDAVYATWDDGDDGGAGFGAWTLSTSGTAGHFMSSSTGNGDGDTNTDNDIDVSGKAWGMYANSNGESNAVRTFDTPLSIGTVFYLSVDNGYIDSNNGESVGFGLRNNSNENLFEFYFQGGDTNYTVNDNGGTTDTGLPFSDEGLTIVFTLTSASTYKVTIDLLDGGNGTFTGNLMNPAGGQTISEVRLFNYDAGSETSKDAYFNSMGYCLGIVTVTNNNDNGANSLRQAISDVCNNGTITFDNNYSIYLDSQLDIAQSMTIDSGGYDITISGDSGNDGSKNVRVMEIAGGATGITISGTNIVSGNITGDGGGILINSGAVVTMTHSTIADNEATNAGGGISNAGTLIVNNSTLYNNTALYGGGIDNATGGTLTVNNSTFSTNTGDIAGGGIGNAAGNTLNINNSTFSDNSSADGAGLKEWGGTTHVKNTIIANSSGADCVGTLTTNTNNLIEDNTCSPASSGDPLLGGLQNNGGGAWTHALLAGSPAIDAGDNASCLSTDQRGVNRNDGACDIGAYELRQIFINEVVVDPQQDWSTTDFDGTVSGGSVSSIDEWLEIYIGTPGLDLSTWQIGLHDGSDVVGDLSNAGAFGVSNYIGSGSFNNTAIGDYLILGNVDGGSNMANNITIVLTDSFGMTADRITINSNATSISDEAVARVPNATDTDNDINDFRQQTATLGSTNNIPNLNILKIASPAYNISLHGELTYTIIFSNTGFADAISTMLTDTLPAEVDFSHWLTQSGASLAADEITWSGTMTANTIITIAFVVDHVGNYADVITNTIEYEHATLSPQSMDTIAIVDTRIIINEIHADPAPGSAGDANGDGTRSGVDDEFIEIFNNTGANLDLSGWKIHGDDDHIVHTFPSDTIIPDQCVIVLFGSEAIIGDFGGALTQSSVNNSLGLNNAGETITLLNDGGIAMLSFTYGNDGEENQSWVRNPDITGSDTFFLHSGAIDSGGALFSPGTKIDGSPFIGCASELAISKTVYPNTAMPSDMITYTLYFTNTGMRTATDVMITDTIPLSVINQSISNSGLLITNTSGTYVWNIDDMAQNDSGIITITGQIDSSSSGGAITNTAKIGCDCMETTTSDNTTSIVTTTVIPLTYTVNSILDSADSNIGDGACDDGAGNCTLRAAIAEANAHASIPQVIQFDNSLSTITLSSSLPDITTPMTIDGLSHVSASCNGFPTFPVTPIILNIATASAAANPTPVNGLIIDNTSNVTVRGLTIMGATGNGIYVSTTGNNHTITCNNITTNLYGVMLVNTNNSVISQNWISANGSTGFGNGLTIVGSGVLATNNTIYKNFIGTNNAGTSDNGNEKDGILLLNAGNNTIQENLISGNGDDGIDMTDFVGMHAETGIAVLACSSPPCTTGNMVISNTIGLDVSQATAIANDDNGIQIEDASGNIIHGNDMAYNANHGVMVKDQNAASCSAGADPCTTQNQITNNSIYSNTNLAINLYLSGDASNVTPNDSDPNSSGGNLFQNFPMLLDVVEDNGTLYVYGMLTSTASSNYIIEVYANDVGDSSGYGEGQTFIMSDTVMTDASGEVYFSLSGAWSSGNYIAATATDSNGNTSEFSAYMQIQPAKCFAKRGASIYLSANGSAIQQAINDGTTGSDEIKIAGTCENVIPYNGTNQVAYIDQILTMQGGYTTTNWTTSQPNIYTTTLDARGQGRVLRINGSFNIRLENLTMTNGTWQNNGEHGGGLLVNNSTLTIINSTIYSNTVLGSGSHGGGLYSNQIVILTNTTVTKNSATGNGGGVYIYQGDSNIVNSLLTLNHADGNGSALYLFDNAGTGGTADVINTTIANPTIESGSSIYVDKGTVNINNTIIASHTTGIERVGGTVNEDYNLFYSLVNSTTGTIIHGSNSLIGNPLFINPALNNYQLSQGSDSVDMGNNAMCSTFDMLGQSRFDGDSDGLVECDMGAYEYQDSHGQFIFGTAAMTQIEGDSGTTSVNVTIQRQNGSSGIATVNVTLLNGSTAISPTDYLDPTFPKTVTFTDGDSADKTISLDIIGDDVDETNETILLQLVEPSLGSNIGMQFTHTLTINDDDTAGVVVNPTSLSISEPNSTTNFNISLTSQPTDTVTISLTSSDTSECTVQNSVVLSSTNWSAGIDITVNAQDDFIADGDQTCLIETSSSSANANYNISVDNVTVTVQDDDTPLVRIDTSFIHLTEGGSSSNYAVKLNTIPSGHVTITLVTSQTEISLNDVNFSTTLTMSMTDNTWQTIYVAAIDDVNVEGMHGGLINHAITASDAPANYPTTMPISDVVATIRDNDIRYELSLPQTNLDENNLGASTHFGFIIERQGAISEASSIDVILGGTADIGDDYAYVSSVTDTIFFASGEISAVITLKIFGDNRDEPDETVVITMTNAIASGTAIISNSPLTMTINDDDTTPVATADDYFTFEDTVLIGDVLANDSHGLTVTLISDVVSGTLDLQANGTFVYTPIQNLNGVDRFSYRSSDGTNTSDIVTVTITITPVNDMPYFIRGADEMVMADAGRRVITGWATSTHAGAVNEISQALTFTMIADNTDIFAEQPIVALDGTLTYTPIMAGATMVTVTLHDDGGTAYGGVDSMSDVFTITISSLPTDTPTATSSPTLTSTPTPSPTFTPTPTPSPSPSATSMPTEPTFTP
ncbi:MAG: hypothetical protein B6242_02020, partial [Anaerolineaceae bacterium 4572_78]